MLCLEIGLVLLRLTIWSLHGWRHLVPYLQQKDKLFLFLFSVKCYFLWPFQCCQLEFLDEPEFWNDDIPQKAYIISSMKCRDMLYKIVHGMTLDLWKVVPIFACTICCHKLYNYPCTSSVNVCIINEITIHHGYLFYFSNN